MIHRPDRAAADERRRKKLAAQRKADRRRIGKLKDNKPERNPQYLDFIRRFLCVVCFLSSWREVIRGALSVDALGREYNYYTRQDAATEAAHIGPHGIGQKASDFSCLPLCAWHHREAQDSATKLGRKFIAHHEIEYEVLIRALRGAFDRRDE